MSLIAREIAELLQQAGRIRIIDDEPEGGGHGPT